MEKLQLMMFEAIGYKLKFSQKVTEHYLDVLGVRFGKNSEMEQLMKTFISDRSTQEEIISNSRHKAYNEFRLLSKMQLKYDIEILQKEIAEQASSPFLIGYQAALAYLTAVQKITETYTLLPADVSNAEYRMLHAIWDSDIETESNHRKTTCGVDCQTICIVLRTMICFNNSLLANRFNYNEAKNTVKMLFQLDIKCAV